MFVCVLSISEFESRCSHINKDLTIAANLYFVVTFRTDYIINVLFGRACPLGKNLFNINNNEVIMVVSTHFNPLFPFWSFAEGVETVFTKKALLYMIRRVLNTPITLETQKFQ